MYRRLPFDFGYSGTGMGFSLLQTSDFKIGHDGAGLMSAPFSMKAFISIDPLLDGNGLYGRIGAYGDFAMPRTPQVIDCPESAV